MLEKSRHALGWKNILLMLRCLCSNKKKNEQFFWPCGGI